VKYSAHANISARKADYYSLENANKKATLKIKTKIIPNPEKSAGVAYLRLKWRILPQIPLFSVKVCD